MSKALALLVLLLPASASAYHTEKLSGFGALGKKGGAITVISEEAMVQFSSGTSPSDRAAALARIGASEARHFGDINWTWVRLSSGMPVASGLRQLRGLPEVVHAEPNHFYVPNLVPNDTFVSQQTNLSQVDAFAGWDFETGASNPVTIAMIDTGIDGTQGDLAGKIVNLGVKDQSQDCSGGACVATPAPTPACNHATRTSGVAAATAGNGVGIAGISWGAKLVSLKVFPDGLCNPTGECPAGCGASDASVLAALTYARLNMATVPAAGRIVVNMSLGSPGTACTATDGSVAGPAIQTEMLADVAAGIVIVASAGNDSSGVNQPANCAGTTGGSGIIPVTSVDANNNQSFFTSFGPEIAANGVAAPGEYIMTTDINNGYTNAAIGTSFSAPQVAGLAALVLSAKPAFTPAQVQGVIRGGADKTGPAPAIIGAGRINVFRTMRLAVRGTLLDFVGDQKAIAFPNPFRVSQAGVVSITIPPSLQGANANVRVYTTTGQLVRTFLGLTWDGRSDAGNLVASGTYVFEVKTDAGHTTGRVAVIR